MKLDSSMPYTFGKYIRNLREVQNIPLRTLAESIQISPAYLSEIERDKRCAPSIESGILEKLQEELEISADARNDDCNTFFDLAGDSRSYSYEDLNRYLKEQPLARKALRLAAQVGLDDSFWAKVMQLGS
jgi:transcriptional regulator with XRE-family HTH domain